MINFKLLGDNKKEDFLLEIFKNRGFTSDQSIKEYLFTKDNKIEKYTDLDNIEDGVCLLKKHLDNGSKMLIVVDCDVDGFTSSAVLYNFLKEIDPNVNLRYVLHEGKQHGFSEDLYEDVYAEKYDLILMPDAGSNDYEQHKRLKDNGTDIIIIDHHEAPYVSEDAVIINNQLSKNYENKCLSGVGVVWHFIECFNEMCRTNINIDKYLDLVALGNIADIMDVRAIETKQLILKGLKNIHNKFLQVACKQQEYSLKGKLTSESIGWYIAPYLNAMIRVGEKAQKEQLFESLLSENENRLVPSTKRGHKPGDTEDYQEQTFRLCSNARNKQNKIVEEGMQYIEEKIAEKQLMKNKVLIITIPNDRIMPEVVGLVANKIASEYQQPTLILRECEDTFAGSGRNFNYSPLEDFRGFLDESGYMELAQGHASAFGVALKKENLSPLVEYCNKKLKDLSFSPTPFVDFEFDMEDESDKNKIGDCLSTIGQLNEMGVYGQGLKEPLIFIRNITVNDLAIYSKKTVTGKIIGDKGVNYLKFNADKEELESLTPSFIIKKINVLGRVNVNEFNNRISYQVIIEDYEKSQQGKVIYDF